MIFVHGCFWHRHPGCRYATVPATRQDFWQAKFRQNVERDRRNLVQLGNQGWRVAVVWECALRPAYAESTIGNVTEWLMNDDTAFETDVVAPGTDR